MHPGIRQGERLAQQGRLICLGILQGGEVQHRHVLRPLRHLVEPIHRHALTGRERPGLVVVVLIIVGGILGDLTHDIGTIVRTEGLPQVVVAIHALPVVHPSGHLAVILHKKARRIRGLDRPAAGILERHPDLCVGEALGGKVGGDRPVYRLVKAHGHLPRLHGVRHGDAGLFGRCLFRSAEPCQDPQNAAHSHRTHIPQQQEDHQKDPHTCTSVFVLLHYDPSCSS